MKKHLFLFALLMCAVLAKAQDYTYDSIVNIDLGFYGFDVRNLLELRDGSIVSYSPFYVIDENGHYVEDFGDVLVKVSPNPNATFVDSTLMANDYANHCLLERNPQGEDNLFVRVARDFEHLKTNLLIRYFDDQLNYDEVSDIVVPLEDTLILNAEKYLLEDDENIIVWYALGTGQEVVPITPVMVRVGLDGTIKDRVELPDTLMGRYSTCWNNLVVYNDSPREYAWSQTEHENAYPSFGFFVVDSLFQLKEYVKVEEEFAPGYIMDYSGEKMLPWDENSYMIASRFKSVTNQKDNGVRITKYDKLSHENLGSVRFATFPQSPYDVFVSCGIPADLKKSADGSLYFAYQTSDPFVRYYVGVAKLDSDLNVLWQRYCLNLSDGHMPNMILSLEEGGLVVSGYEKGAIGGGASPTLFYLFFHEDGTGFPETETYVRPYLFYPNPVADEIHLQFSPDAKPLRIDLYDLNGHLLHSQGNGLDRIDMKGLPIGIFTMRVTLEGGRVYSDKVMKK